MQHASRQTRGDVTLRQIQLLIERRMDAAGLAALKACPFDPDRATEP
jgi:hypothetical protein